MHHNIRKVAARYGVPHHTIWRWVKDGFFPQPYMFGPGTARWPEEDLRAFDAECATVAPRECSLYSALTK